MNRIFHARIAGGQYLFLIIAGALAFYNLWDKQILMAIVFILLLVFSIEKAIHTTYTIATDGKLVLSFGRFSRAKEISLKEITSIERTSSMQIGKFAVMRYVLIKYGNGKCQALLPVKEEEFIRTLQSKIAKAE